MSVDFENVNLNDIDPSFKNVEEGFYNLRLNRFSTAEYDVKEFRKDGTPNPDAGQKKKRLNLGFVVVDDEKFAGRQIFITAFPNGYFLAGLRRIMDATGVQMDSNETLFEYLQRLVDTDPAAVFKGKVTEVEDDFRPNADGSPGKKNEIDFRNIQPAG